ncbi:hypothetical protein [Arthrobacter sulfonylureivorans]|uniref:Translation initiation factor 2 n=1 Tax=Arthrobacter sulfonylureivorans TaxID=2486855 RepID=A0ABY3W681_9MICC|nr:hypothetical protein [Arthrobacter sulfonylureivorans]UNK44947.1 hypothetical protein MNQ99_13420 [Arthrobacter sulfonylureivorans]
MSPTADGTPFPRRRDVRSGAAEPAAPTGMIPVVPLVSAPSGTPLPARRELRTGLIQVVPPAAGQAGGTTRYVRTEAQPAPSAKRRKGRGAAWAVCTVVVLAAAAAAFWLMFVR